MPGTSQVRFVDPGAADVALGDWVLVDSGPGDEPASVVVTPDQWIIPPDSSDLPVIVRVLDSDEQELVAERIDQARALTESADEHVRRIADQYEVIGTRLTFAGDALIVVLCGERVADPTIAAELSGALGMEVHVEVDVRDDPQQALIGGSTGIPVRQSPAELSELIMARMDVSRHPGIFAPQGIPRLGSQVVTPAGIGKLVAVDIRHWKATIAHPDGLESVLGIDELQKP
jgi:hypothetical protein